MVERIYNGTICMRMYTEKFTVYQYDELTEEAKEKAVEYFQETEDFAFLSSDMHEELAELLTKHKISYSNFPKVYYDLSYCQGDGAMFEGTVYWKSYTATIKQSGHYYHYNSKNIEMFSTKTDKEASEKAYNEFNELYVDICRRLEKHGYSYMEEILEVENIEDMIRANGYEFFKNGKLA